MTLGQLPLLGRDAPRFDARFHRLQRTTLDTESWVDHVAGWVRGDATLLDVLDHTTHWHQGQRLMYERRVDVPRLTAGIPDDGPGHPIIEELAAALSGHYGADFDAVSLALYRDGRDSVAWHRDKKICELHDAVVAIVSLGGPRPFMLRPFGGGGSISISVGWGDLVVMGGACQRHWEHCVPKVCQANPRMAIMLRASDESLFADVSGRTEVASHASREP